MLMAPINTETYQYLVAVLPDKLVLYKLHLYKHKKKNSYFQ